MGTQASDFCLSNLFSSGIQISRGATRSRARWHVAAGAWLLRVVCIGVVATAPLFGQVPTAGLTATPQIIGPNGIAIVVPTFTNGTPVLTRTTGPTTVTLPAPMSGSNIAQRLTATTTYQLTVTNASNQTASATATVTVATPAAGDWTSQNNSPGTPPDMTTVNVRAIAFDPGNDNSQYLTASGQQILNTSTGGPPWSSTTISGFVNSNGLTIGHPNGGTSIWSLGDCDGVLWHSTNGINWTEVTNASVGLGAGLPAVNCAALATGIVLDLSDPSQSTLYVAFTSGVFRSTDNGASSVNVSPPTFAVGETPTKLAITDDGTVFLGASLGDLFKLTGVTWTQLITAPSGAPSITALSVDPATSGANIRIVIGKSDGSVSTSSNSGVTFTPGTQLGGGTSTYTLGTGGVTGIVVSPDGVTYAIANHRVFRSIDYGATFTDETVTGAVPLPDDAYETIVVDPAQPQTVYVVGSALGVYKRTIGTPAVASDPVTLASGLNQPSNIAADLSAGYVYFTDNIDNFSGQVRAVYKSGGKLTKVAPGTNLLPSGLLPLATDLLIGTTPSAPATTGAVLDADIGAAVAAPIVSAPAGIGALSLTADSNTSPATIYFNQTDGTLQSFALGQSTILSVSTGTPVTANQMYVPTVPAIASNLYFCGPSGLFQMPKAGGTPTRIDSNVTGPCAFSGTFAYFSVFSTTPTNHFDVRKYDLTNVGQVNVGESTIVGNVVSPSASTALATDGLLLYFATPASSATATDAAIQQVVLATSSAASFATNLNSVGGIALDGKRVYWTTSDGTATGGKVESAADRATPTISINNIPANAVYGGSFAPTYAYSGDGTTSTTSSTPGTCTVSGGIVSFVGAGTCTLTANATATTNFAAATGNAQSFTIGQATTTISISNIPASAVSGGSFTPTFAYTGDGTTSVTSGTLSTCTVAGAVVNFVGGGTCSLTSHATAGTNYAAVDGSVQSFTIVQQATTALTVAPASGPYGGTASLTATLVLTSVGTGVNGQLVTFSVKGNPVGSATTDGNGFAFVSASIAGINGGVCAGCVTANFAGNTNYSASSGSNSLTVTNAPATISIVNIPGSAVFGGSFIPAYAYSGDGTTSATSSTPGTCTVSGGVVGFVGAGVCTLTAHATAGAIYAAVDGSAQSFSIGPATTTLLVTPSSGTYGSTANLNASLVLPSAGTGVGGQTVTFKLNGNLVGSVITDGNGFAFVNASVAGINGGTYPAGVTASFAGSANYAASSGSNSLTVNPGTTTISISNVPANAAYGGSFAPTYAYIGNGTASTASSTPGTCTVSGGVVNFVGAGTCTLAAQATATTNYTAATGNPQSFTIVQATPIVTFTGAPGSAPFGATFNVTATTNASTTAVITASGACSITSNTVKMTGGTGTCSLAANWAAGANFLAASANQSTAATKTTPTVTFSGAPASAVYGTTFNVAATTNASSTAVITASGACSIIGNTVKMTSGTGTCNLTATWLADNNYSAAQVMHTVNALPATLSITASSATMIYGGPVPAITPIYNGLLNGATTTMTPPSCSTAATSGSPVGTYTSSCDGAADSNYTISYHTGTVRISYAVTVSYSETKTHNSGSSVTIKVELKNYNGANVSSSNITLTVVGLSPSPAPGTPPTGTFTFMPSGSTSFYQYNLKSTNYPVGTYTLSYAVTGDPVVHQANLVIN